MKVFELVDKLIDNSEGDEEGSDAALKMAYVTGDARYEGDEALEALETDLEDEEIREEESDVEVEEMVSASHAAMDPGGRVPLMTID